MSGVTGIFFLDGRPVDRLVLERMVESLAHRGPDGRGVWSEGSVGLGHQMLWTTPESLHESFPLVSKSGDLVLTADARLDNRYELVTALTITGHPREEISDGELILGAYEKWGERCPEKLLGDFAFAIWDRRRQALFCARDHAGVKPFYYHRSGQAFVFASEIKALLRVAEVPRRLNEVWVAYYLDSKPGDTVITPYQEILRLPPAHSMTVNREEVLIRPYWSLDLSREVRFRSDEEYSEAFRELFTEAVRCRLRGAFPVGSLLSGGLDSSSIVCVARELLAEEGGQRLHTFSAVFPDVPETDESVYIDAVLAQGGLEAHKLRADRLNPLAELESPMEHEDEALNPNVMQWAMYGDAHQQGVRIILDGEGGDGTVSYGFARMIELARRGRLMSLLTEVSGLAKRYDRSRWAVLRRYVLGPLAPRPVLRAWQVLKRRNQRRWTVINPRFARNIGLAERTAALAEYSMKPPLTSREEHWRSINDAVNPKALELFDRRAAPFSIEPRYPFFDRRLIEFCLALPPEQKLNGGWDRVIARRALANSVPKKIRWRDDKANFVPNYSRSLLIYAQGRVEEVILKDAQAIEKYVDVAALREAYHRYKFEGASEYAAPISQATTLALWLQQTGLRG